MQLYTETSGRGPDLVMLHGWGLNGAVFLPLRESLGRSFSVTTIDLPGHGLSPEAEQPGLAAWTDALLAVAPRRAHWFGWSLGGLLALNAALRARERVVTLSLIASTPRFTFDSETGWNDATAVEVLDAFLQELDSDMENALSKFLSLQLRGAPHAGDLARALKAGVLSRGRFSRRALVDGFEILKHTDLRADVAGLETPTLVVSGGRDQLVPAGAGRWLAESLPNGKWAFLEDASHMPFLTHWSTIEPVLESFCATDLPGSLAESQAEPDARYALEQRTVRRSFNRAANTYDEAAVVHRAVREDMLGRLDFLEIDPDAILDLGAGPGLAAAGLKKRFPRATIVAADLAGDILAAARGDQFRVCADALELPFADASFDIVFSNLMLHYCGDPEPALAEMRRVLKPHGCVLFSTFGPDTLRELRAAFAQTGDSPHVIQFIDMHDIGDAIVRAGLQEPVLDSERYTLTYAELPGLMRDLKAIGASNPTAGRQRGLTGKQKMASVIAAYESYRTDGRLPATFEVVYAQAWVGRGQAGEIGVPVDRIGRR